MIAHEFQYKDRQVRELISRPHAISAQGSARILILPTEERHLEQMEQLQIVAYNAVPGVDEYLTAAKFRSHLHYFPEGQFVAVDTDTDCVVGLTASMRLDFDPTRSLLESWAATTGDG